MENKSKREKKSTGIRKFTWGRNRINSSRFLPIDYSREEFAKTFHYNERTVQARLMEHEFFEDTLIRTLLPKGQENCNDTNLPPIPLPLEAGPFLDQFFSVAQQKEYHTPVLLRTSQLSCEDSHSFVRAFCSRMEQKLIRSAQNSDMDFIRHIMFSDSTFNQIALENLWESELSTRVSRIRELGSRLPAEQQAAFLEDVLQTLDQKIVRYFDVYADNHQEKSSFAIPADYMKTQLSRLLSFREDMKIKSSRLTYELDELSVRDSLGLKQAFFELDKTPNKDPALMSETRSVFLADLAKKCPASIFEKQYFSLRYYLDFTHTQASDEELRRKIYVRCCQLCSAALKSLVSDSSVGPPFPAPDSFDSHLSLLIDSIVNTKIIHYFNQLKDLQDLIGTLSEVYVLFSDLRTHDYQQLNGLYCVAQPKFSNLSDQFVSLLGTVWRWRYSSPPSSGLDTANNCFSDPEGISAFLFGNASRAANDLGITLGNMIPGSETALCKEIKNYNKYHNSPKTADEFYVLLCSMLKIQNIFLLIIYHHIADLCSDYVLRLIERFLDYSSANN